MKTYKLGTVIASRELCFAEGDKVVVRIGKPQRMPDHPTYFCPYQILGIGNDQVRRAGGLDAVHAIQLVLEKIGIDLHVMNKAKGGKFHWEGGEDGDVGFPLSDHILNVLKD